MNMMSAYLADLDRLLQKQWPDNRTVNIVCHGHSVPAGYFKTPVVDTFHAYPHLFHVALKQRYPCAVINVIVTGIGGETSESGAARFEQDVLRHQPDLLCLDYALNDRRIGLEAAAASWRRMIESAKAARVPMILLTPTGDVNADLNDPEDPLHQHADQIRCLAKEYHLALADSFTAYQTAGAQGVPLADLLSQSNHPNRKGHELVVNELMNCFPECGSGKNT